MASRVPSLISSRSLRIQARVQSPRDRLSIGCRYSLKRGLAGLFVYRACFSTGGPAYLLPAPFVKAVGIRGKCRHRESDGPLRKFQFQFALVVISEKRTLSYATSFILRDIRLSYRLLVLGRPTPHRRFRTAVVAHRTQPNGLQPCKLQTLTARSCTVASMERSSAMFRKGIAGRTRNQNQHSRGDKSDPRTLHFHVAHLNSQRPEHLLTRPHRRLRSSIVPKLIAAFGFLGLRVANIGSASRNRGAQ
jgi:hypothetical protein